MIRLEKLQLCFLALMTLISLNGCRKHSSADLEVKPTTNPIGVNVQFYDRFYVEDRISWIAGTKVNIGGISQLFSSGKAYIYLNTYRNVEPSPLPKDGVEVAFLGKSHECVGSICKNKPATATITFEDHSTKEINGNVDEVFDNGTFRMTDPSAIWVLKISDADPTFVCNPLPGSAKCCNPKSGTVDDCQVDIVD